MPETYSRVGSLSLIKEVTANTPLTPTTFIPFNSEGIVSEYPYTPSVPVSGTRAMNLRAIKNKVPAPKGNISLNVEPKTIGHFLNSLFGGFNSGQYMPISSASAAFTVGETVTGGSSGDTATVVYDFNSEFLLVSGASGEFTDGEQITGGGSGSTATLTEFDTTVYGHAATAPTTLDTTYTVQKNYTDRAVRYVGCRFHGLDALAQADNIITADIQMTAQSEFRHARVTAITTSGAGAKTISLDQTQGLVVADEIKLYRPGTGFLDFEAASDTVHTVATIPNATSITVTNLETNTAVGDLIVLNTQTPSYTIDEEFCWIGGSQMTIGNDIDNLATLDVQDYTMVMSNELEERHAATGTDFEDLFPSDILQKGFIGSGSISLHNEDENYYRHLRINTAQALDITTTGNQIGSTGIEFLLRYIVTEAQFDPYQLSLAQDDIVQEDIPFTSFYNASKGYSAAFLLVNDVSSY